MKEGKQPFQKRKINEQSMSCKNENRTQQELQLQLETNNSFQVYVYFSQERILHPPS